MGIESGLLSSWSGVGALGRERKKTCPFLYMYVWTDCPVLVWWNHCSFLWTHRHSRSKVLDLTIDGLSAWRVMSPISAAGTHVLAVTCPGMRGPATT